MSRQSWTRDVVIDALFSHDGRVTEITGLRHVFIYRIEPGVRSVIDVMMRSGTRVTANVMHGAEIGSAISSMEIEVSDARLGKESVKGDSDFSAIMEIVIRVLARGDEIIDLTVPVEPQSFMRKLVSVHVEAAWRDFNSRGVEYEDALEGVRRYFSKPIDG